LVTSAGVTLRTVAWLPSGDLRGTVLLLQGRGDFIEKYFEVASDLLGRGFAVVTFDWRGQGGSQRLLGDPRKGHVDAFADYGSDLAAVVETVMATLPRPWVGLAHSMGAAVLLHALAYALDRVGLGRAAIPGPARRGQASPAFQADNLLTSDPIRFLRSYEILTAAPQLGVGKPTIGWLRAAYDGMAALPSGVANLRTPLLIVAGDRDRVTHTPAALQLARHAATAQSLVVEGAAHDVMMERDSLRERFWAAFDGFTARERVLAATGRR
jgi:lysophospholipase